jgi:pimeloyl-ACP methyl ester carboxylesterase
VTNHNEEEAVMPIAKNGSVELYWESTGHGPPVLLIAGQGMTLDGWWSTVPVLARNFRVITFDNRDTGRSSRVAMPYAVASMAEDAVAVLDAAGAERAHVYGLSLGGMVAQELALHHPDRVEALVLGATSPGGRAAALPAPLPMTFFARAGLMGTEEAEWAAVPYTYAEATRRLHAERIAENIKRRLSTSPSTMTYLHQAAAVATHSTFERLDEIASPTLVLHGAEDLAVPPQNARLLAERIPGAELKLQPGAGHLYFIDEPRVDREIARFLLRHSAVSRTLKLAAA